MTKPSGYTGGYVLTDNPDFVEDIMRQYTMVIFPEKQYPFTVDLEGTFRGIEMVRKYQYEM